MTTARIPYDGVKLRATEPELANDESGPSGETEWLILQLADSAFPTGGFAHSGGLEAAWRQGELRDGRALAEYLEASLVQTAHGTLLLMFSAFDQPNEFASVDSCCDLFLNNHVANRASRLQGQALANSARKIFAPEPGSRFEALVASAGTSMHLATVFGVVTALLMIPRVQAGRLFLFCTLRGLVSSAVRLGIVGPMEGQRIQRQMSARAESELAGALTRSFDDLAQTAPILDIFQAGHDRLYSRLFQS